jgi:ubiquinone/menaquinone biosynthesis C-methylase UbiE
MSNENVQTHFSKLAEDGVWASLYSGNERVDSETWSFLIRARRVAELLQTSGTTLREVADVGCGTAPVARTVTAMGARYIGVDFSPEMIESARANIEDLVNAGRAELRVGDVTALSLPDQSCDAVLAMGVLEYLAREAVDVALRETFRVLRRKGAAILTIPKRNHWGRVVSMALEPVRLIVKRAPSRKLKLSQSEEFERLYLTPGELDRACRAAGLRKIDDRHYNVQPISRPMTAAAPRLTYFFNRPFEPLSRVPIFSFLATGYIGMYRRE